VRELVAHAIAGSGTNPAGRDQRDCPHLGKPHRHGTRTAYVADNCRCTPCRAANRAAEQHRTAALREGRWEPLVDSGPARAHLSRLREHGVGLDQIARLSGTPKGTIRRLLGAPTSKPARIRTETSDRLLAIQISTDHLAPRSQVDAFDTLRRIEALASAGYSILDLARALDKSAASLRRTLTRRIVTAQTAVAVNNLYDLLMHDRCFDDRCRAVAATTTGEVAH
jgi:lambda repressor-like predicted transcriptional regulator